VNSRLTRGLGRARLCAARAALLKRLGSRRFLIWPGASLVCVESLGSRPSATGWGHEVAAETASERPWWRDHIALATGLLSVTFVALRILATAHFSPETAAGILVTAGTGQVVVGTLLGVAPVLPAIAVLLWVTNVLWRIAERKTVPRLRVHVAVLWSVSCLGALATPLAVFLPMLVISLGCVVLLQRRPLSDLGRVVRFEAFNRSAYAAMAVVGPSVIAGLVATSTQVWLPTESIKVIGRPAATGYVLQDSGSSTVVLWDHDRRLERFSAGSITRSFCDTSRTGSFSFNQPAIAWVYRPALPSYPKCPTD
jgi:hypothetical protein